MRRREIGKGRKRGRGGYRVEKWKQGSDSQRHGEDEENKKKGAGVEATDLVLSGM